MSVSTLYDIRLQLGRYGIPILLEVGNIGNLFTAVILGRTLKQRFNSCALYLLCASLANWLVIDTALVSSLYGIDHIEPIHQSNVLCKLRWYGGHVLFMGSRNFMIAACIDRWALGSQNTYIRSICRPESARRITAFIFISTLFMPVALFVFFGNNSGQCIIDPSYNLAYTIFAFIAIGILPPLLMILFTFLARYNSTKIRSRVRPVGETTSQDIHIHKRDHDLMKMLIGEVLTFCLTTWPYPLNTMHTFLAIPIKAYKSPMRVAVESLISFIIHPLLSFTYCCTQFYVYGVFSYKFRQDFYELFRPRAITQNSTVATVHTIARVDRDLK